MLDVLLLLAVTRGLLERADDEGGCGGDDGHGGLTVLDGELHGDAETLLFNCNGIKSSAKVAMYSFEVEYYSGFPLSGMWGQFRTQSPVAFAISSPTFLGDRPRGPILGASAEEAPTSPPVARRWLFPTRQHRLSRLLESISQGVVAIELVVGGGAEERLCIHDLHLIGVELGSCLQDASSVFEVPSCVFDFKGEYSRMVTVWRRD